MKRKAALTKAIRAITRHSTDKIVLVGPVVTSPSRSDPYMVFVTSDRTESCGWNLFSFAGMKHDDEIVTVVRRQIVNEMRSMKITVYEFDDELPMAQRAALLWPCKKVKETVATILRERYADELLARACGLYIHVTDGPNGPIISNQDGNTYEPETKRGTPFPMIHPGKVQLLVEP